MELYTIQEMVIAFAVGAMAGAIAVALANLRGLKKRS